MNKYLTAALVLTSLLIPQIAKSADQDLVINIATAEHPHVRAIQDGRVSVPECEVRYSTHSLSDLMNDLTGAHQYDVVEVELLPYLEKKSAGELKDYTLIPVFLSRKFQMRNMYIRTDRGINRPEDLRGKTAGVTGYKATGATWFRGILQSSWSVTAADVHWIDTQSSSATVTSLTEGLSSGTLDAAFIPDPPQDFLTKNPQVRRLFPDYQKDEYEIFKATRIFPIITTVAVRQSLIDKNPWLPEALFIAFSEAKKKSMADLTLPLPWGGEQLDETEKLMGKNFWSYGVQSNPKTLGAIFRYANEQLLFESKLRVDDVFAPSTITLLEN